MGKYSLIFKVANLPIQFYCKSEDDATFLRKRYPGFLVEKESSLEPAGGIFFIESESQNIKIKKNKIYLSLGPSKKKFGCFDNFFEIALMPILGRNQGFILHASSLVKNGLGYIFTGREDTGKSTIRKLFPELNCLGDDTAIVRKVNNKFFLFGSPFYQRDFKPYSNRQVPIAGAFVLTEKANFNLVKTLFFPDNFKAVLSNAYISDLDKEDQEKELLSRNCYEFCLKNKIFALSFKKDRSFWPLIEEVVG